MARYTTTAHCGRHRVTAVHRRQPGDAYDPWTMAVVKALEAARTHVCPPSEPWHQRLYQALCTMVRDALATGPARRRGW